MTKLTFLGTGPSQGIPVISCKCGVCASDDMRDKRLRSSVMIEHNSTVILIDAGPDFRQQMLTYNIHSVDGILITHDHKDHIGGLDDVRALNYTLQRPINIYASEHTQQTIRKDFDYAFKEYRYPGVPEINLMGIDGDTPFAVKDVTVTPVRGFHYKMEVLGFRIGGIAYLTDFNYIPEEEIDKIRGVDILAVNALRKEEHISHFNLSQAIELHRTSGAGRTYLTHISHQMGLHGEVEKELPANVHFAYDGLTVYSDR